MRDTTKEVNGHLKRDEMLRNTLLEKGVALNEKRSIELHFWASKQEDAVMLAKALYNNGLLVLTLAPVSNEPADKWNIEAGTETTVENLTSPSVVQRFVKLAAEFNATYDGWGTLV